jgi:putative ABC transport system substrate-binding protein
VRNENDLETGLAALDGQKIGGLLVDADTVFLQHRGRLAAFAIRHALPSVYDRREFVSAGGLMSYGANPTGAYSQAGFYAGRILRGEKPADLPVQQSTKFEFVINLGTVKTLGLTVPPGVLAIADEVIE